MEKLKDALWTFVITLALIMFLALLSWGPLEWLYNSQYLTKPAPQIETRQELDAIHAEIDELKQVQAHQARMYEQHMILQQGR